jgi:hypothetical protein
MSNRKYIVFRALPKQSGWKDRKLEHTQGLTAILAEHFDSTGGAIPEPGYRVSEYVRIEADHDPKEHGWSTHYKVGDWEVEKVEVYEHEVGRPYAEFDMIVICYCKYAPINAPLKPMPDRIISADSFGSDIDKYQQYVDSQKLAAPV